MSLGKRLDVALRERDGAIKRAGRMEGKIAKLSANLKGVQERSEHFRYEMNRLEEVLAQIHDRDDASDKIRELISSTISSTLSRRDNGGRTEAEQIVWLKQLLSDAEAEAKTWRGQLDAQVRTKRKTHSIAQGFYERAVAAEKRAEVAEAKLREAGL